MRRKAATIGQVVLRNAAVRTAACLIAGTVVCAAQPTRKAVVTPEAQAIEFCREEAGRRLKYSATVRFTDGAEAQAPNIWLVSGVRTAKGPGGNVDQLFTCRVELVKNRPALRLIQLFRESTKSGRDVFETPGRRILD